MDKVKKSLTVAKIMEKVARKTVEASAESKCVYIYHQPKMPEGIHKIKR